MCIDKSWDEKGRGRSWDEKGRGREEQQYLTPACYLPILLIAMLQVKCLPVARYLCAMPCYFFLCEEFHTITQDVRLINSIH